jgi:hypothetical protein
MQLELEADLAELRAVNGILWDVEDQLRLCEARGDFGPAFVTLARAVYQNNDRRALIKQRIDQRHGSAVREEKMFLASAPPPSQSAGDP